MGLKPFVAALVMVVVGCPSASHADNGVVRQYLVERGQCFGRTYGPEHLKRHPYQLVERVVLCPSSYDEPGFQSTLSLAFRLRGETDWLQNTAGCNGDTCFAGNLGGGFTITPDGPNLLMTVGERLELDTRAGRSPDFGRSADDKIFLLYPCTGEGCNE